MFFVEGIQCPVRGRPCLMVEVTNVNMDGTRQTKIIPLGTPERRRISATSLRPDQPITPDRLGAAAPAGLNDDFVFPIEGGGDVSLAGRLGHRRSSRSNGSATAEARCSTAGHGNISLAT